MIRCLAFCLLLLPAFAKAATPHPPVAPAAPLLLTPPALCEAAIAGAEVLQKLPVRVLHAIALRESGRSDPDTGRIRPWPWTINFEGAGHFYASKEDAIAAVRQIQAAGGQSIDVGCMQVNLMHHPTAFATLEEAFDPITNAAYAGRFLRSLFTQTSDWGVAIASYHSRTPGLGEAYRDQVVASWNPSDPAVLSRLTTGSIASSPLFPMISFSPAPKSTVLSGAPAAPGSKLRPYGQFGGAYRSFLPPTAIYADFSPKRTASRQRMRPLDMRLSTSGLDLLSGSGLVVPKGIAARAPAPKAAGAKPVVRRPGVAG